MVRLMEWNGMELRGKGFAVALLACETYDEDPADRKAVLASVKQAATACFGRSGTVFPAELGWLVTCVIALSAESEARRELLMRAKSCQTELSEGYSQTVSVALSDIHASLEEIPEAYAEAVEALDYRIVMGAGEILSYESAKAPAVKPESCGLSEADERALRNCLRAGDAQGAKRVADAALSSKEDGVSTPSRLRLTALDICRTATRCAREMGLDLSSARALEDVERIMSASAIDALRSISVSRIESICESAGSEKGEEGGAGDILAFISAELGNPDLSVSLVSDRFAMTPSAMSRHFKKRTGLGLLDYINRLRVERAKELLSDPASSVKAASEAVGIVNMNSFIRIFRKYEGVTPGVYRSVNARRS